MNASDHCTGRTFPLFTHFEQHHPPKAIAMDIPRTTHLRKALSRRGSVIGLMAILLPVLAILAVFCINIAHIQVTRTELMVATDAAARAGGRAFSETQTTQGALQVAANTAAMNNVNGEPLLLSMNETDGEMEFGITTQPGGEGTRFLFQKVATGLVDSGVTGASAFRVNGKRDSGSISGRVPLLIPGVLSRTDFATNQDAVAMQVDRDISLVLDRSGSMEDVYWDWPSGTGMWNSDVIDEAVDQGLLEWWYGRLYYDNGTNYYSYREWVWTEYYAFGPLPKSAWEYLLDAVDAFVDVLDETQQEELVSISSYSTNASLDLHLEEDYEVVTGEVGNLNTGGWTAIGKGMEEGIETLLHSSARPFANKTMVVMTDGNHNRGIDPVDVANLLMSQYNLTIHTVTLGGGANQNHMQQVATIGKGNHYHAEDGTAPSLIRISKTLPGIGALMLLTTWTTSFVNPIC